MVSVQIVRVIRVFTKYVGGFYRVLTLMVENPSFYRRSHMLTAWMHAPAVSWKESRSETVELAS
jgi:hypothetical protein